MAKVIIERSGRCLGGDNIIQATLLQKRIRGPYQITVKTGVHNYAKKLMVLNLTNCTLDMAKEKFYEVLTPWTELWEMTESANNDK